MSPISGIAGHEGSGPFLHLHAQVMDGVVSAVTFRCHGCVWANATGMITAGRIEGRRIDDLPAALAIDWITELPGLPLGKRHIVDLAIEAGQHFIQGTRQAMVAPGQVNSPGTVGP